MAANLGTVVGPGLNSAPGSGLGALTWPTLPRLSPQDCALATLPRVKYMCESCGFIYDPAEGDPDGGIPPGTAFEDIPDTWFCPVCGARKRDFTLYED